MKTALESAQAGQRLFLPTADLGRVDAEQHLRDLGGRFVRLALALSVRRLTVGVCGGLIVNAL